MPSFSGNLAALLSTYDDDCCVSASIRLRTGPGGIFEPGRQGVTDAVRMANRFSGGTIRQCHQSVICFNREWIRNYR